MRSTCRILVAAAVAALAFPQLAMAGDVEEQLRLMNERMAQMESQLEATKDELDASKDEVARQQELIQKAGIEREAQSGLSKFLSETQFSGNVAVSWGYNFNNPNEPLQTYSNPTTPTAVGGLTNPHGTAPPNGFGNYVTPTIGGINSGALGITAPYHSNHNSFQVDQFLLSMLKPATAESRGGFAVDLAWGVSADGLGLPAGSGQSELASGDVPHLYQAYVNYLAPLGPGLDVGMGRFATWIGAESFVADQNWNITRGLVWALQPVNHTGIWGKMEFENGFEIGLSGVNGYSNTMKDFDNQKGFLGTIGWTGEVFGLKVNGYYGGNISEHPIFNNNGLAEPFISSAGTDRDTIALVDTVLSFTPSDRFAGWVNFDWYTTDNSDANPVSTMRVYALAAAGRFGITEALGFSLRYEFVYVEDHPAVFFTGAGGPVPPEIGGSFTQDGQIMALTGTFDYALTDSLTVKVEGRYDWAGSQESPDNFFASSDIGAGDQDYFTREDQFLGIVQMLYSF